MQPNEDRQEGARLSGLLREWTAPDLPSAVEHRVLAVCRQDHPSRPGDSAWWRFLLTGYIRVPVYVVYVLAVLLTAAGWRLVAHTPSGPCVAGAHSASIVTVVPVPPGNLSASHCDHASPAGFC